MVFLVQLTSGESVCVLDLGDLFVGWFSVRILQYFTTIEQ